MFFIVTLFVSLCLMTRNHIQADYILSFTPSDLCYLRNFMNLSSTINKDCTDEFDIKRKAFKEFIQWGNKKGFTRNTQFAKGRLVSIGENFGENYLYEIRFDATLFDLSPDTILSITIFKDWTFTVSPAMDELVKKLLEARSKRKQEKKLNNTVEKSL
jgi:hypothetical protein